MEPRISERDGDDVAGFSRSVEAFRTVPTGTSACIGPTGFQQTCWPLLPLSDPARLADHRSPLDDPTYFTEDLHGLDLVTMLSCYHVIMLPCYRLGAVRSARSININSTCFFLGADPYCLRKDPAQYTTTAGTEYNLDLYDT